MLNIVILAGGNGTRLWPMSRRRRPKQFFPLLSDKPLLVETYERFLPLVPPEHIYIVSPVLFLPSIVENLHIQRENIIIEPEQRDTAAAMAFAVAALYAHAPDTPMVFIPSDHFIANVPRFLHCLAVGSSWVEDKHTFTDIGILPQYPSTALGYTHIGRLMEQKDGIEVYEFLGHREKPLFEAAQSYVNSGEYLWHANYYMATPRMFLNAFTKYAPDFRLSLEWFCGMFESGYPLPERDAELRKHYQEFPRLSFDYAVTEKMMSDQMCVLKGDFGWSDIGSWEALFDALSKRQDANGNIISGEIYAVDTHESLIYAPAGKYVAALGLSDMVIVDTGDVLLVCPKGQAQGVKQIVHAIEKAGKTEYL